MELLLDGEHSVLEVLRAQYAVSRVGRIETTGVGFFVHFKVPPSVPDVEPASFELGDVWFKIAGAEEDGGVILFIRNGRLAMLEGFNYVDPWPEEVAFAALGYLGVGQRRRDEDGRVHLSLVRSEHRDKSYLAGQIAGG